MLWKHTDLFTESQETRRQRRLVVSFFATVGNYDYGFYWYLYLDGTIQLEVKATGVRLHLGVRGGQPAGPPRSRPGLGAPYHQHLFSARLDMMVDGVANAVEELDAVRVPMGPGNAHGNAFTRSVTRLSRESEAARGRPPRRRPGLEDRQHRADQPARPAGRRTRSSRRASRCSWRPTRRPIRQPGGVRDPPPVGHPVRPGRALLRRRPGQPAPGRRRAAGLPGGRTASIDGEDIVVWHTFGLDPLPAPGGLAGHAGGVLRLHAQADRASSTATPP